MTQRRLPKRSSDSIRIEQYGVVDGLTEMFVDSIDPFGFHHMFDPPPSVTA